MTASSYMSQWVNWGGEWEQVGAIYRAIGQKAADMWLAVYDRRDGLYLAECPSVCPDFYVA